MNTTTKKVISVDVDGVLSQFEHGWIKLVNKRFPEKNVPADFVPNDWSYSEILTPDEFKQLWPDVIATKYFWENLPAYGDNVRALGIFLREMDHKYNVYYITSRPDTKGGTALEQTRLWLRARRLYPEGSSIIVVRDPAEKEHMLRGIGAFASIDDYLPTVQRAMKIEGHHAWLLDRPWNRPHGDEPHVAFDLAQYLNWLIQVAVADEKHPSTGTQVEPQALPPGPWRKEKAASE